MRQSFVTCPKNPPPIREMTGCRTGEQDPHIMACYCARRLFGTRADAAGKRQVAVERPRSFHLEVAACQQKAEAAGLQPGTAGRAGNMAAGAGLGLIAGAAVGASTGG